MAARSRVVLVELNELTQSLMLQFMGQGLLPNFRQLYDESIVFTTDAQEQGDNLNPWIQWVTLHTGLRFADHGAFRLGEGERIAGRTIGDAVLEAGLRVWLCGSMNVRSKGPVNGAVLPDPWAKDARPSPAALEPFFRFIQTNVSEHTSESLALGWRDYASFLIFMMRNGLSPSTVGAVVRQLGNERLGRGGWRRVAILDQLMWDVFRSFYRRLTPDFSTFFSNSVAHLQHTHWREFEPELFSVKAPAEDQAEYQDAILFGYQRNDALIGRFMNLAGSDATLIFATALGQQPCVSWEESGGKHFYRPHSFDDFLDFLRLPGLIECAPVMSEEFTLSFESESAATDAEAKLSAIEIASEPGFWVGREGSKLYAGCKVFSEVESGVEIFNPTSGRRVRFLDLFYGAGSIKSGVHHPDGMLWIRSPVRSHRVVADKVPLTAVAPTVLKLLGVQAPPHMDGKVLV